MNQVLTGLQNCVFRLKVWGNEGLLWCILQ